MTKEELNNIARDVDYYSKEEYDDDFGYQMSTTMGQCREIVRLARLGLWAEEYGIKVVEGIDANFNALLDDGYGALINISQNALLNLLIAHPPKDRTPSAPGPAAQSGQSQS